MNAAKLVTLALFAVGSSLSGCDSLIGDGYDVTIQTDRVRYKMAPQIDVSYTIANVGDKTVYYLCGGSSSLEEWIDDELNHVWVLRGQKQCLRFDPIAPGEQIARKWSMREGQFKDEPVPEFSARVRYRIRESLYKDEGSNKFVDEDDQLSNWFEILP